MYVWEFISSSHLCFHNPCSCSGLRLPLSLEDVPKTERRGERERGERTQLSTTVHSLSLWVSQYMTAPVLCWCDISYQILRSYDGYCRMAEALVAKSWPLFFMGFWTPISTKQHMPRLDWSCTVELKKYTPLSDSIVQCSMKIACNHFCCILN